VIEGTQKTPYPEQGQMSPGHRAHGVDPTTEALFRTKLAPHPRVYRPRYDGIFWRHVTRAVQPRTSKSWASTGSSTPWPAHLFGYDLMYQFCPLEIAAVVRPNDPGANGFSSW